MKKERHIFLEVETIHFCLVFDFKRLKKLRFHTGNILNFNFICLFVCFNKSSSSPLSRNAISNFKMNAYSQQDTFFLIKIFFLLANKYILKTDLVFNIIMN